MKQISFLNCIAALLSLSCLTVIGLILFAVIFFQRLNSESAVVDSPTGISAERSHMQKKDKEISSVVALVSDSENDWSSLSTVIKDLEDRNISNAFHLGDITHLGVESDLNQAKSVTSGTKVKVEFVPGDRDLYKSSGVTNFNKVFGQNYKVVSIGGLDFLLIDNSNEYEGIDEAQWTYIEENIDDAEFVVLHNPIYFSDSLLGLSHKGMGQYSVEVEAQRIRLLSLIRDSNVKAVFAGDQHLFSESADSEDNVLNHYVVGALNQERNLQKPNYVLLTLYTDGDYHVEQVYIVPSPQSSGTPGEGQ